MHKALEQPYFQTFPSWVSWCPPPADTWTPVLLDFQIVFYISAVTALNTWTSKSSNTQQEMNSDCEMGATQRKV